MSVEREKGATFVVEELSEIRDQLKFQLLALSEKENELKERESIVSHRETAAESIMIKLNEKEDELRKREILLIDVERCVAACYTAIEECIEKEIQQGLEHSHVLTAKLESRYHQVKKDNSRLKDGLSSICKTNGKLKKQLEAEQLLTSHMEKQMSAMQARLLCLKLQCNEPRDQGQLHVATSESEVPKNEGMNKKHHSKNEGKETQLLMQLVHELLWWVSKALPAIPRDIKDKELSPDILCTSTFSLMSVLLPCLPIQYHATCLQFLCEMLLSVSSKTKLLLASSLRRIGEVFVSSLVDTPLKSSKVSTLENYFCRSSECRIRVLSCLVILQIITRADAINLALQSLKCDLRQGDAQEEFILFGGVNCLLPYVNSSSKHQVLCSAALDIFILLSSDAGLAQLLNDQWFKSVANLLKKDNLLLSQIEKVSVLLQRLSSLRESRPLFGKSELGPLLHSLLISRKELSSFIHLNISSTLSNIGSVF